jgi:steroid delta-isomerase-like uncharacterized protein
MMTGQEGEASMTSQEPTLLRRWFEEVWNQRRDDLMEQLASKDIVCHGTGGPDEDLHGLDRGFRPFYKTLLGAFPDLHFTVEATIREGDIEALRWSARATHAGDHLGFPATNKSVTLTGMVFARLENGKFVEAWDNWDMMGLMKQTGMIAQERPVPADG